MMTWESLAAFVDTEKFITPQSESEKFESSLNDDIGVSQHQARLIGGPLDGQLHALPWNHGPDLFVLE